uniref:No apical meristem-associated C-terminal domain-containing protein n=1 Tax=Brassica oleracea var. oleracea TaxID=109376 RepID=A0A0D3AWK1_BRAOL
MKNVIKARRFDGDSLPLCGSPRRNDDGSIGGSRRRRKTVTFLSVALLDLGKWRETVTSHSIGGSLRRSILATVAVEANRKNEDSVELSSSQVPFQGSLGTEASNYDGDIAAERRKQQKWTPTDDVVLISSWLNTSNDPVDCCLLRCKSSGCWLRREREASHCKQRWPKINDLVSKFCGLYEAATREKTSGQNETGVLKLVHQIFYNYKKRFTLEHTWKELRHDQKWCDLATGKNEGSSKKRKCEDGADSSSSQATCSERPPGVKAAKMSAKKPVVDENTMNEFQKMWTIKQSQVALDRDNVRLDAVDEYLRLGAITARLCVENFVEAIINFFGDEYLRRPTPADLQRLLHIGELRGFPGMIGSIDCMHWEWKNCPTAWKWQYSLGTLNDINVLDRSSVFDDIINGQAPQVNFSVNEREYHLAYYLTDDFQQGEGSGSSHVDLTYSINIPTNIPNQMGVRTRIRDRQAHQQLKDDLVEHIYSKFGRDQDNN